MNSANNSGEILLEQILRQFHAAGKSGRLFYKQPHPAYGHVFQFDTVPCCVPLICLAWINQATPGVFFRAFIGRVQTDAERKRVSDYIGSANADLPAGCLAIQPSDSQVVFKHAIYLGSEPITEALIQGVLQPSAEFVAMHWANILDRIHGKAGSAHRH